MNDPKDRDDDLLRRLKEAGAFAGPEHHDRAVALVEDGTKIEDILDGKDRLHAIATTSFILGGIVADGDPDEREALLAHIMDCIASAALVHDQLDKAGAAEFSPTGH